MLAFHNDKEIKQKYIDRVRAHMIADEIIKGLYWENGRGCAVGCTIHGSDHQKYEDELGIPTVLARLEDSIFEGLPNHLSKMWPLEFLEAIEVGADLSWIWPKFVIWLMTDKEHGVIRFAKTEEEKKIIHKVSDSYRDFKNTTAEQWYELRIAARKFYTNAAAAADTAAADTAYANASAYAANAAANAAIAFAYYAADAGAAAREEMRAVQSIKFLELLKECKYNHG